MANGILLKGARVIDPANGIDEIRDLGIENGVLVDAASLNGKQDTEVIDLAGKVIAPGFIDLHVHFREPGFEYKEDIASGTRAAAAGGYTTVVLMPNTNPAIDRVERIVDLEGRIAAKSVIRSLISGCLSVDRKGQAMADIVDMAENSNIVALSDDGNCVQHEEIMVEAGKLAARFGLPVLDHCEDEDVMEGGVVRRCEASARMEVPGMPGETESNIVTRNIRLAKETGAHFHLQHISYKTSIELLRQAKNDGIKVSAEAAPHHLALTCEEVPILGTNSKMNPPLGTDEDRLALIEAVADGTVDVIATDHAPHAPKEKVNSLVQAPFGIIGLETCFPVCYTELVASGKMSLADLITRMSVTPARILGMELGDLSTGSVADLVVLDTESSYTIDIRRGQSRSVNSPFHRNTVKGKVLRTYYQGRLVHQAD